MPKTNKKIDIQVKKKQWTLSHDQSKPNIAQTAREFASPRAGSEEDGRWKIAFSTITQWQEAYSCTGGLEYIEYFDAVGASVNRRQIIVTRFNTFEDHHDSYKRPATNRGSLAVFFLKRHPEYYIRRQSSRC